MRGPALVFVIAAALLTPGAAGAAATPIDVGPGANPHIAVDGAGAAHVTYAENVSGQDVTHYCKIAKAGTACAPALTFTYPAGPGLGGSSGVWPLLPGDPRVLVIDARCCTNYATKFVYSSADGGASFDGGTEVGDDNNSGAGIEGGAIYTGPGALGRPAESVLTIGSIATLGLSFQATGTTGPPLRTTSANVLTQNDAISGTLGLGGGGDLVAAWRNIDDSVIYWRHWTRAGDVNDSANWDAIAQLELGNVDSNPQIAYGPTGVYIAYDVGAIGAEHIVVRKFTGAGWGDPITLSDTGTDRFDLAEDPSGVLHFVRQGPNGELLYQFAATAANTTFSAPQTIVGANQNGGFVNLQLAVGNGSGWVTWQDGSPVHVRTAAFTPSALPPPTRGETVNAVPQRGTVLVKLPAGAAGKAHAAASGFVPLESLGRQIPVGSTLDTKKGTVRLLSATDSSGGTQSGDFSKGLFNIGQGRKSPLTTLSMTGGGLSSCGKVPAGGSPKPASTAAKRKRRTLFSNVKGRFRVRGRHSSATTRGTAFSVTDTCKGTLTQVKRGTVKVRDFRLRKTRTVKAGHSYFARRGNR